MNSYIIAEEKYSDFRLRIIRGYEKSDFLEKYNVHDTWTPKVNDRLFFMDGCVVPRFKVRDAGKKQKFSVTIKSENASVIVLPTNPKPSVFIPGRVHLYPIPVNVFEDIIKGLHESHFMDDVTFKKYCSVLKNFDVVHIKITGDWYRDTYIGLNESVMSRMTEGNDYAFYFHTIMKNYIEVVTPSEELMNYGSVLYSEKAILDVINQDNQILDQTSYETLRQMGNSEDESNLVTMMEIMANTNYKKSAVYLLMLFIEFGNRFYGTKYRNHVNFKSLVEFLDIDMTIIRSGPDFIYTTLKKLGIYTPKNLLILTKFYIEENGHIPSQMSNFHKGIVPKHDDYDSDEYASECDPDEVVIQNDDEIC